MKPIRLRCDYAHGGRRLRDIPAPVSYTHLEMSRLKEDLEQIELANENFSHYNPRTPLLPSLAELDLIVRYESHLSRVFDRKLSQLQGLQRARRGDPPTPAIKIDLD